jgi:hypothetical protein
MWCCHCQSDVPHTATTGDGGRRCGRCGRFVPRESNATEYRPSDAWRAGSDDGIDLTGNSKPDATFAASAPWDEWKLASEVRHARRICGGRPISHGANPVRIDATNVPLRQSQSAPLTFSDRVSGMESWTAPAITPSLAFVAGAMAFGYGVGVTALRMHEFASTQLGVPMMIAGLFSLVLGVLLHVIALRRDSRMAREHLRLLDARLQEYRQSALLTAPQPFGELRETPPLRGCRQKNASLGSLNLFGVEHL